MIVDLFLLAVVIFYGYEVYWLREEVEKQKKLINDLFGRSDRSLNREIRVNDLMNLQDDRMHLQDDRLSRLRLDFNDFLRKQK